MSLTNPDVHEYARVDPWLAIPGGLEAVGLYAPRLRSQGLAHQPDLGDLSVLPHTLLLTGTRDLLHPDCVLFAAKARDAGVDVDLVVERGMMHVWPLLVTPEARRARDRIVAFLREVESACRSASRRRRHGRAAPELAAEPAGSFATALTPRSCRASGASW